MLALILALTAPAALAAAPTLTAYKTQGFGAQTIYHHPGIYNSNGCLDFAVEGTSDANAVCKSLGLTKATTVKLDQSDFNAGCSYYREPSAITIDKTGKIVKVNDHAYSVKAIQYIVCE